MKLNNNYRIDNERLMVDVQTNGKSKYIDINNLPFGLQVLIVNSNNKLLDYIIEPSGYLKKCIFSFPALSV